MIRTWNATGRLATPLWMISISFKQTIVVSTTIGAKLVARFSLIASDA